MKHPKRNLTLVTRNGVRRKAVLRVISLAIAVSVVLVLVLGDSGPFGTHYTAEVNIAINGENTSNHESSASDNGNHITTEDSKIVEKDAKPMILLDEDSTQMENRKVSSDCNTYDGGNGDFQRHIDQLFELIPDETRHYELLRQIKGIGKKQLRELGIRTRSFKRYFDAWEAAHMAASNGATNAHDDIIQYLRCKTMQPSNTSKENTTGILGEKIRSYESFRSLFTSMGTLLFPWTMPYFADHMSLHSHIRNGGRGIVTTTGDKQAPYLLTSIRMIRKLGCDLPVEIMYLGDEDLGPDFRAELEQLPGVITRDLKLMVDDRGWELNSWAGKPFALLLSSFREAILVDADALFFQNPEALFEDAAYLETGALFFHDRILSVEDRRLRFQQPVFFHDQESIARHGRRWLDQTLPEPISAKAKQSRLWTGESRQVQESGVVVVDKWRHFVSLLLVTWINGPGRGGEKREDDAVGFYDMFYGDKESYWIGWELAGDVDYSFHTGGLAIPGPISEDPRGMDAGVAAGTSKQASTTICAPQLLHLDHDGQPLWFNGWVLVDKFDKANQTLLDFDHYMKEPPELTDPEAWYIGDHNLACLSASKPLDFTSTERQILKDTVQIALDAGSYKPGPAPSPQTDFY